MKKVALLLAGSLVIFGLLTEPVWLGHAVQDLLGGLKDGAEAVIAFVKSASA